MMRQKKRRKVFYLCHVVSDEHRCNYENFPAVTPVVEYVSDVLQNSGFDVEIISGCRSKKRSGFLKENSGRLTYTCFASACSRNRIANKIAIFLHQFRILKYLIENATNDDTILIYHSFYFIGISKIMMRIRRIKYVLQIEEYYSYINHKIKKNWKKTELAFFKRFDKFIFVNDIIAKEMNRERGCVLYGPYKVNALPKKISCDNEIRVLYAGSINQGKAALSCAKSVEFLPDKYRMTIAGFGDEDNIKILKEEVENQNEKAGFEKVTYVGFINDDEYGNFLRQFHIGIAPYTPPKREGWEATKYFFSSKILIYMSYGLHVVASKTASLMESELRDMVSLTESMKASDLADAIKSVDFSKIYIPQEKLNDLNGRFHKALKTVILE